MDAQAATLLSTLKRPAVSSESKLNQLNALKSDIKHYRVPESAQATIFECIKLAITQQASSTLASSAFSTFGHLVKRLKIQDAEGNGIVQLGPRMFPALHDRLGDTREPMRAAAAQALTELYPFLAPDIEIMIRDEAIGGSNPRAKQAGIQWVLNMHRDEAMPFKSYTQAIVARVEDADGSVRETAKNVLIELFKNAPDRAKTDLKKQLKAYSVRHTLETQILSQIELPTSASSSRPQTSGAPEPEADMAASTRSLPSFDHVAHFSQSINSQAAIPPPPEVVPMDPIYVHSKSELEEMFREMLPHFEGKETEQNWTPRDKSVLKIRRLTKGNAPSEFHQSFMAGIKSTIEGSLKVANSLRTTMSTNGCQLVRELLSTLGPAMDPHMEMLLQSFIKMSAATKHIAAENGKATTDAVYQNCTYKAAMMQHIWSAAQEKNVPIRQCTADWLRTVLKRQMSYKHHFESSGGLELAEKSIKKGLDDANPKVKEGMRATYWTFAKGWPDRANVIMSALDPKSKTALERDSNNPNAALHNPQVSSVAASSRSSGTASRNALREMMAEQRKAKAAGQLPDRPSSAMAQLSPAKPRAGPNISSGNRVPSNLSTSSRAETRVVSSASTVSITPTTASAASKKGSSLMSGPVRRPRRPELSRPQTADPYASKRLLRPETPVIASPAGSIAKGTANSKSSLPTSSVSRNRAKTAVTAASPSGSPVRRSPRAAGLASSTYDSRPTSKGSSVGNGEDLASVREDDFTLEMPKGVDTTRRPVFAPGHKRPGLGQTMSVDTGVNALTEEEGLTMVMPNLQDHQPRVRSPLASYRSPKKEMSLKEKFADAREMVASWGPRQDDRILSPEAIERAATPRSGSPTKVAVPEEVQIYEDPFVADNADAAANGERKPLSELPVNENVRMQSPTQSNGSSASPQSSPRQISDARSPNITSPQDRAEVLRDRRLLASGIDRIRAKTLDAHGFRRVQDLAKSNLDIWDGGKRYDELMSVLLEYLQSFDQDARLTQQAPHKAAGLKAQALGLVRALLYLHKKNATAWHAKTLVAVLACRKGVDANSHVLADMERTADDIVRQATPESCIDAIIDYLPTIPTITDDTTSTTNASRSTSMALTLLRRLLDSAQQRKMDLGSERKARLVRTTATYLDDADAEVRLADVELASDLFELFGESDAAKGQFWGEFKGANKGRLDLLTYYIAKREKGGGGGNDGRVGEIGLCFTLR